MADVLGDLRVLEIAEGWSGAALAGRLLADLGATVLKVEPPDGDWLRRCGPAAASGLSYAFVQANAGKQSIVLDLQTPAGWASLMRYVASAHVLVHGGPPAALRALERAGLREAAPQLTVLAITPFGLNGPLAERAGCELTIQAASGVVVGNGFPEDPPVRAGVPLAQHAAALFGVAGLLAALRSGCAQTIDVAAYDAVLAYQSNFLPGYFLGGKAPARPGNRHPLSAPWNTYPCRDGWVMICTGSDSQWVSLLEAIGRTDVLGDEQLRENRHRVGRVAEVDALIAPWTRERTVGEVIAVLEAVNIPAAPLLTVRELLDDVHFRSRDMVVPVGHGAAGELAVVGSYCKLSRTPGRVRGPAPLLGQHGGLGSPGPPLRPAEHARGSTGRPPLAGVRVIELAAYTAGPFAARILANLGAEVIKVEPREGDVLRRFAYRVGDTSYIFHLNNGGKRSVTLDVGHPDGRTLLLDLARKSDVLIENFATGTMERWGLGYETLAAVNPRLIYVSVNGFGQSGPRARQRAYDSVIQALSGMMSVTGWPHRPPTKTGISSADYVGATAAVVPILAALYERERSGLGQRVEVAMHDVAGWLTAELWGLVFAGQEPTRLGNRHPLFAPHGVYPAADGLVAIAVETDGQWGALCVVLGVPDLAGDPRYATRDRRVAAADDVDAVVAAWAGAYDVATVVERCSAAGVPAAPVLEVPAAVEHPHTRERGMIVAVESPAGGQLRLTGLPIKLSASPAGVTRAAAPLGAHNEEVFCGLLGLSERAVADLRARGVI